MAKIFKRIPLVEAGFPLISRLSQQSVMIPQGDVEPQKDRFPTPQVVYMQNVIPSPAGYKSITRQIVGTDPSNSAHNKDFSGSAVIVPLRDAYDVVRLLFVTKTGDAYIDTRTLADEIKYIGNFKSDGTDITYAYLKQQTYVYIKGQGCYIFDLGTMGIKSQELNSIEYSAINGISAASGYLILYDDTTVYYSSLTNPTDFYTEYEIDSGAGSIKPLYLKGPIVHCEPIEGGFLIYTTKNVVAALYSGQLTQPFVFKEISNSSGVTKHCHVTANTNNKTHFAWTEAGLLQVSNTAAQLVSPELTEYMLRCQIESFDLNFQQYSPEQAAELGIPGVDRPLYRAYVSGWSVNQLNSSGAPIGIRLSYIGNRYLIISYAVTESTQYETAFVFDETLQRWGKFKFPHIGFFDNPIAINPKAVRFVDLAATTFNDLGNSGTAFADFYKVNSQNQQQSCIIGYLDNYDKIVTGYVDTDIQTFATYDSGVNSEWDSFTQLDHAVLTGTTAWNKLRLAPYILFGFFDITRDNSINLTDLEYSTAYTSGFSSFRNIWAGYNDPVFLPFFVQRWPTNVQGYGETAPLYAFNCSTETQAITLDAAYHQYLIGVFGIFDLSGFSVGAKAGGKHSLIQR